MRFCLPDGVQRLRQLCPQAPGANTCRVTGVIEKKIEAASGKRARAHSRSSPLLRRRPRAAAKTSFGERDSSPLATHLRYYGEDLVAAGCDDMVYERQCHPKRGKLAQALWRGQSDSSRFGEGVGVLCSLFAARSSPQWRR